MYVPDTVNDIPRDVGFDMAGFLLPGNTSGAMGEDETCVAEIVAPVSFAKSRSRMIYGKTFGSLGIASSNSGNFASIAS